MNKKIISTLLISTMLLSMTACSVSQKDKEEEVLVDCEELKEELEDLYSDYDYVDADNYSNYEENYTNTYDDIQQYYFIVDDTSEVRATIRGLQNLTNASYYSNIVASDVDMCANGEFYAYDGYSRTAYCMSRVFAFNDEDEAEEFYDALVDDMDYGYSTVEDEATVEIEDDYYAMFVDESYNNGEYFFYIAIDGAVVYQIRGQYNTDYPENNPVDFMEDLARISGHRIDFYNLED